MLRPATDQERIDLLDGSEGFVVEENGVIIGHVGYRPLIGYTPEKTEFYINSLAVDSADPMVAVKLSQAVLKKAKALGFENCLYHVLSSNPTMLRLLDSSRASIDSYFVRINT